MCADKIDMVDCDAIDDFFGAAVCFVAHFKLEDAG